MIPLAPIATARLASATLMMPFRQNCPLQACRISSASFQLIDWSSIVEKYSPTEMATSEPSLTKSFSCESSNLSWV